ncbi:M28 family metallopeptidase [Nocardioides sp.]|uniref:M28 family metallopeptidase n=1 Tax=Nocardioides sp. TaxID=35761 RepID=UPI002734176A|nr:M28 family peptidase [Nocardioides sp.]MDP3893149.1 M28 family peptidase [Nocardioides sp.]
MPVPGAPRTVGLLVTCLLTGIVAVGCTGAPGPGPDATSTTSAAPEQATSPAPEAPAITAEAAPADPADVRPAVAMHAVDALAGRIGPRMATGPDYRRAGRWVDRELTGLGYDVRRQPFDVPSGVSWGVPVDRGRSFNLVATPPGFDETAPHLLVGAHLDTVPRAPGAEDNASGIGALLSAATAMRGRATRLPVVLVAFGAEEPRGPGDDDHHYGSRHYVSGMSPAQRSALRGMVSLDRVGVGSVLPVCSAGPPDRLRAAVLRAARRAGVDAQPCADNRSSDHWSFVRDGLPAVRLGSTPYPQYHSAEDRPAVVDPAQLRRAARTVVAWVSGP